MLKNAYFYEKSVKIASTLGAPPPNPRLPPRPQVVTPAYCYNFVEYFSSAKCGLLSLEKEKNNYSKCSAFAFFALLHLFFTSNSVVFVDGERKNVSCPRAQGTLATPVIVQ